MRRLAAIMFTDIVGYSALTQKNEALALELLEGHRILLRPIFVQYGGREIETAGDLFFVEFDSAVEGVSCAIDIQKTLFERNRGLDHDHKISLRIGLHIGDVVYKDKHVHGDGVNIAARIQPLARPGGIAISEDVARQIRNKIDWPVVSIGRQRLKNITMPVEVYEVVLPWEKSVRTKKIRFNKKFAAVVAGAVLVIAILAESVYFIKIKKPSNPHRLRLAVLPLDNIGDDSNEDYFADGMTEELISSLSKINNLHVIARTSSMKYKNVAKSISEIGDELNVGSILEGSIRKDGSKARVKVQLVDVATEENTWSVEYDRNLQDILLIQTEIAQQVASELKIVLASSEVSQLEKNYTRNIKAFEEYLIGKHYLNIRTSASIRTAVEHLEKAVSLDPEFALSYATLAYSYSLLSGAGFGTLPGDPTHDHAREAVMKALSLDETLAEAHAALGYITFRMDWDWEQADSEFKRAIALKPGYAQAHEWYALFLSVQKRFDEALKEMKIAHELDPMSMAVNSGLGRVYHYRGEMDKAIRQLEKTIAMDPTYGEGYFSLAMAHFKNKEYDKALVEMHKALEFAGRRPVMVGMLGALYVHINKPEEANKLLEELSSDDNYDKMFARSMLLMALNRTKESAAILKTLVKIKYGMLIYLNVETVYFGSFDEGTLKAIVTEMGLKK